MRAIALVLVFAGCSFPAVQPSGAGDDDLAGPPPDAYVPQDGTPLDAKGEECVGSFSKICVGPQTAALTLSADIDTEKSTMCASYTADPMIDACVIAAQAVTIENGKKITVTGAKKLIIVATTGAINIGGTLDVASHTGKAGGPANGIDDCGKPVAAKSGQGGGYGGSFWGPGNNGGNGANGNGVGGQATAAFEPTVLHGGCPGGDGQGAGGDRGRGGGAVYLAAKQAITISGSINASGAGGDGGANTPISVVGGGAGGGGGSGGMIVLDAPTVAVSGTCFAAGGGGGGGASGLSVGRAGGEATSPTSKPSGGNGGTTNSGSQLGAGTGGNGGDGAYSDDGDTIGAQPGSSGGGNGYAAGAGAGAGGGNGYIKIIATTKPDADQKHIFPDAK